MKNPRRRKSGKSGKPCTSNTNLQSHPSEKLIPAPPPRVPAPREAPKTASINLLIHPPKRSTWTPFSHASTELNLLARPDFDTVCHAIYQSYHLGALFPNQNPPPILLPPLKKDICKEKRRTTQEDSYVAGEGSVDDENASCATPPTPPTPSPWSTPFSKPLTSKALPLPNRPPENSPWAAVMLSPTKITSTKPAKPSSYAKPGLMSQAPLMEIFRAVVPMTPVRARSDSPYVATREKSIHIHDIAYAQDNGRGPQILCKAVINEPYQPDVANRRVVPTLTYVGFEYCDETCLTYVPIKDTRLLYRINCRRERWFGEEVQMIMRRSVYERIKEMCVRVYLPTNPGTKIDCGNVEFQGANVMLYVMVKSNRTVRIELGERTVYRPLLETLNCCKHDIFGEGLLHVRFSKTPGKEVAQLRFILFGIQVKLNEGNKGLKIFEIAESDRKKDR